MQEVCGLRLTNCMESNHSKCKAKVLTLKVQINARKIILDQNADKGLFAFSAGGKSQIFLYLSLPALIVHVMVISMACHIVDESPKHIETI